MSTRAARTRIEGPLAFRSLDAGDPDLETNLDEEAVGRLGIAFGDRLEVTIGRRRLLAVQLGDLTVAGLAETFGAKVQEGWLRPWPALAGSFGEGRRQGRRVLHLEPFGDPPHPPLELPAEGAPLGIRVLPRPYLRPPRVEARAEIVEGSLTTVVLSAASDRLYLAGSAALAARLGVKLGGLLLARLENGEERSVYLGEAPGTPLDALRRFGRLADAKEEAATRALERRLDRLDTGTSLVRARPELRDLAARILASRGPLLPLVLREGRHWETGRAVLELSALLLLPPIGPSRTFLTAPPGTRVVLSTAAPSPRPLRTR